MKNVRFFRNFSLFLGILLPLFLLSFCDKESTKSTNNLDPINITGSWELTKTITANSFGLPNGETDTETIYIEDIDGILKIINSEGVWGTGTVDGRVIQFTGTESSDDFDSPAQLITKGTGSISEAEIVGRFTVEVYIIQNNSSDNPDGTINLDFEMIKMQETTCYDRAVFGDPAESDYILPFPVGAAYPIYQSYCWRTGGHRDQLAYDFAIPVGDSIIAARGGVVREVRQDSPDTGEGAGEHNYVYVQHEDGTLAFYAHLMQNSVLVGVDDTLESGQYFARSGNSGESGEPHLHFGIYENYPPVEGNDAPVNFRNADGPLDSLGGLIRGQVYQAMPH